MKIENQFYSTVIFFLLLICLVLLCCSGCTSKKRVVEKEKESVKIEENSGKISENIFHTSEFTEKRDTIVISGTADIQEIELVQADPSKTIIFTDASGKTTTITGANAVLKSETIKTETQGSSEISEERNSLKSEISEETTSRVISTETATEKKDVKKTGTSIWIYIAGVVVVLILLFRKTVKKYFTLLGLF